MALIKCNECEKKISDKAASCPSCGAPVEKRKRKSRVWKFALWTFVVLVAIGWLGSERESEQAPEDAASPSNVASGPSTAEAKKPTDGQCEKGDLRCWGEKNVVAAGVYCKRPIENLAKYNSKWTDGFLEPKFSRYRWSDVENNVVTYIGDKIQFQNGFGAFMPMIYECDLSPDGETVLEVRVREGRLPG